MKLLIASDLHGSAFWTGRLVEFYRCSGASRLVLLGDLLYHGPRNDLPKGYDPKAVIALLNPLAAEIVAVRRLRRDLRRGESPVSVPRTP